MLTHKSPALQRLVRATAMVLAVILIPAVPASALTFLTPWEVIKTNTGGARRPRVKTDLFPSIGSLTVNMRRTSSPTAEATVTATRKFKVRRRGELIAIGHAFETLLRDASLRVTISITGPTAFGIPTASFNIRTAESVFGFTREYMQQLTGGQYTISINIRYKNRNGAWDNKPPSPGSPHAFSIRSI